MDKTVSRPGGLFKETVNSALNVITDYTLFYNQQNNLS